MATLFANPRYTPVDAQGDPHPGATLTFYAAGTTTPQPVYTTSALTTPHPNPVTANSAGQFPAIYYDDALQYRALLRDATGVLLYDIDLINSSLTAEEIGRALYPRTAAEISAGVTPAAYRYKPLHVQRYGAALNNSADDATAIQTAINVANAQGGGVVHGFDGRTAVVASMLTVLPDVTLDLDGGKIRATLSVAADRAVRLRNGSVVQNGEIEVQSSGSPGSQAGAHSCIVIGPLYGEGGTPTALSADHDASGWVCRNLRLSSNKASGAVGIQVMGSSNNGLIENIEILDSAVMFGGIHLDWGTVGSISSADIPGSRTLYDAGSAYTTHPNNIRIRNIKVGILSRPFTTPGTGSDGIRISGCHNISIENVFIESVTEAGFFHTAGDLGYEFADTTVRPFAHRGITVRNYHVFAANKGNGAYIDCYADNIAAATYTEVIDTVCETDLLVENFTTKGDNTDTALAGIRLYNIRGATLRNCQATQHLQGVFVDQGADRCVIEGGRYWANRQDGAAFTQSGAKPSDIAFVGVLFDQNGQNSAASRAGIRLDWCDRPKVHRCTFGANGYTTETTQDYGIYIFDSSVAAADIQDNYVHAVATSGTAYLLASSEAYGVLWVFRGNNCASGITTKIAGVNIIPVDRTLTPSGTTVGTFQCAVGTLSASTTPPSGTWVEGDRIYYTNPAPSDYVGTVCTVAGTVGSGAEFKRFGATVA